MVLSRKKQRFYFLLGGALCMGISASVLLYTLQDQLVFFYTPSELTQKAVPLGKFVRIGGLVEEGSVRMDEKTLHIHFRLKDQERTVEVHYQGLLPDLFRENQGVVAEGHLETPSRFKATQLFAKHDETYMPPEVAKGLQYKVPKP